jgi:anti-sigma factor RsiW
MNLLSDDILNKYIDGELDHSSLKHVNEVLSSSTEDKKRFQSLLAVHLELKKIKDEKVTDNFTNLVMKKLQSRNKAFKEQRNFVFAISSIFVSIMLFILGLVIYYGVSQSGETHIIQNYTQHIITFFNSVATAIAQIFTPKGISIFGSIISLGILISGYFFFENLKASKQKIHKSH